MCTHQQELPLEPEVFTQRVTFSRAKDWLHTGSHKNYGHIGMQIHFALIGPLGAVKFTMHPDWYVKSSRTALLGKDYSPLDGPYQPSGWGLSYHSYRPQYEGQEVTECNLLSGGRCYNDSSSLNAKDLVEPFLAGGDEWLWRFLQGYYNCIFLGHAYPDITPQYEPHPDVKT